MSLKPLSHAYSEPIRLPHLFLGKASISFGRLLPAAYVALDLLALSLALAVAYAIRTQPGPVVELLDLAHWQLPADFPVKYAGFFILFAALVILFLHNFGLYTAAPTLRPAAWCWRVAGGVSLAALLIMSVFYMAHIAEDVSRFVMFSTWGLSIAGLLGWRMVDQAVKASRIRKGRSGRNVLIVGAGASARHLASLMRGRPLLGFCVKGFVDDAARGQGILGTLDDVHYLASKHFIEEIFITPPATRQTVERVMAQAQNLAVDIKVVPDFYNLPLLWHLRLLDGVPVCDLYRDSISELALAAKRLLDLCGACVGLAIGVPLTLAVAAAIKLEDGGPIFYCGKRMGRKGKVFHCYKFRTMVQNADALKGQLQHLNERNGPMFKITDDPRITRVGRILRKFSLDEWPQFLNVLKGEMSLVGPRPPTLDEVEQYEHHKLEYFQRLDFKPGMTSLWAVQAQREPDFDKAFELDLRYIEHWSLALDLKVLLLTVTTLFKGMGR